MILRLLLKKQAIRSILLERRLGVLWVEQLQQMVSLTLQLTQEQLLRLLLK